MQRIHRKIRIIDGRERRCQAGAAQMGLGADGQSLQIHFQPAIHRSAQSAHAQVRDHKLLVRELEISPCFDSVCMKPNVRQIDLAAGVVPAGCPLAVGIAGLAGKICNRVGHQGLTKNRAQVRERQSPAVPQIPIRSREAGQLSAEIEFRMRQLPNQLIQFERVTMQRELRRDIGPERRVLPLRNFHLFPLEVTDVGISACSGRPVIQFEFEILAFCRERHAPVIDQRTAVSHFQPSYLQIKKVLLPGLARHDFRRRQITVAVLLELHCNLGTVNHQFAQRKFAAD